MLLAASVGSITIKQYWRISYDDNFVKAKDSSLRVRDRSWNMAFYLNVFFIYLPTIKDLVGYYKFRNEVMVWFMQMICLHPIANGAKENPVPIIFHIIDPKSTHLLTLAFFSQVILAAWHFQLLGYFGQPAPLSSVVYIDIYFFSCNNYGVKYSIVVCTLMEIIMLPFSKGYSNFLNL